MFRDLLSHLGTRKRRGSSPARKSFRPGVEVLEDRQLPSAYIVAPGGNDNNPGTIGQPLATIQQALDLATNPGDTVQVRAGTYHEKLSFSNSGDATGFITLEAYGSEHPVLAGDQAGGAMITLDGCSYVRVIGLTIADNYQVNGDAAIEDWGSGSHIEIRNNSIHDMHGFEAQAIAFYGSEGTPLTNVVIDGNHIDHIDAADSETVTLDGNVTNFQVTNNTIHDTNNIGIDLIGGEAAVNPTAVARNGLVRGNVVYQNHSSYGGGYAAGIYVDGGSNIVIEDNVSYQNDTGIEVGAENPGVVASGVVVRDNLIYDNDKGGLVFGGYDASRGRVRSCSFYNNTVVANDQMLPAAEGELVINYGDHNVVTNNIFVASAGGALLGGAGGGNSQNVVAYNLYYAPGSPAAGSFAWNGQGYDSFAAYRAATGADQHSLFADPQFVSTVAHDFHLRGTSPARDAGSGVPGWFAPTDFGGLARPQGPRPDLGAFEVPFRPGTLQFALQAARVKESAGSITLTVTRTGGSDGTVTVHFVTANGTARAGVDYTAVAGTVVFAPGQTTRTITVPLRRSLLVSGKTFSLTLSSPGGGALLGVLKTTVLTILPG